METLLALLTLTSLGFLVVGIFSPQKSLFWYKKERTKKTSALIYGISTFICFAAVGAFVEPAPNDVPKKTKEEKTVSSNIQDAQVAKEENKPSYNKIGDEINVGNFIYKVNGIKFAKTVGNEFTSETADGIFLLVDLTVKNVDTEEHTLDNSMFKLLNEKGVEFDSSTEGTTALELSGKKTLFLKQHNPNISKQGFLVFEVPEKGIYDLLLSGGFWNGKKAAVKLTPQ